MVALILDWCQAYEAGVLACGGEGYHLAKLHRYGFPVPDGGVVVADIYRQLIHGPTLAASLQAISPRRAEDVTQPGAQEALARLQ
jgi:rifampicin phosphotransferase